MSARSFHVLAVCTGNICRSPIIERLFAARLRDVLADTDAARVEVSSAGTWGHEGSPMEDFAAECLTDLGGDPTGFTARMLEAPQVKYADLVLAATREHRAAAVTLDPTASRRAFTLLEFSRLLSDVAPEELADGDAVDRIAALVPAAGSRRGLVRAPSPQDDDLRDPYGAPRSLFAAVAGQIDAALAVPMRLLEAAAALQ